MADPFDDLGVPTLATLVREYLLCGHLIDRSGMPQVLPRLGLDGMTDVAIDEWMGASPIYTERIQKLLRFEGTDVETIFKGMQLDIGAPPQFMDFRYGVIDANHGEFHLACCGALMDVEPMGEDFVRKMCHDIEDPTFDATAAATNPKARMRPVHRPPRVPADREPHCRWTVTIEEDNEPLPYPDQASRMATSRAAQLPLPQIDEGGRTDYAGPLEPDLALETFSRSTLLALLDEVALQGHLLTMSYADAVERRTDEATMREIVRRQFTGVAGVAARRIAEALGTDDVSRVLTVHPAFHPRGYIDVDVSDDGAIVLRDCPAIGDRPGRTWADVLADGATEPLDAIVRAVDPRAYVKKVRRSAWTIERGADVRDEPGEVKLTRYSTGASFVFERR